MPRRHVVVVGGGITGLAVAYYLGKARVAGGQDLDCTLVEGEATLGGKVTTRRRDGFVVDGGPDSFLTQKPWALDLCRELGLTDRLIGAGYRDGRPQHPRVYVLHRGKLVPLPEGMSLVVPTKLLPFAASRLFSTRGKLRVALDLVLPRRTVKSDESVASFVRRRLGEEALERVAEPLMAGIHAADPEHLSLDATFPRLRDMEAKHRSLIRAARAQTKAAAASPSSRSGANPPFVSLLGGMAEMVDALAEQTRGARVIAGHQAVSVETQAARPDAGGDVGRYSVRLDDGKCLVADSVVLSTPAYVTADLVATMCPGLAWGLRGIRYTSTATVSLGYDERDVTVPLEGSGFLVPRSEGRSVNAGTWSSLKLQGRARPGQLLVRLFIGGPGREHLVDLDDSSLVQLVQGELAEIVGLWARPTIVEVFRYRLGVPQYDVGHLTRVSSLEGRCPPGIYLCGSAYRGVGIPDCVHSADQVASSIVERTAAAVAS